MTLGGKLLTCNLPDSVVLTLREERPSADSCGDPSLEKLLPEGCGAEAVFNFSWEKEVGGYGSGDEDDDDDDDDDGGGDGHKWTTTVGTTVFSTRTLLSLNRTTRSTAEATVGAPNRTVSRLPPRFTPSLETRYSSFQQLLRLHMNTFNQRLSMLERNTLDMKESIQRVEDQQKRLSSQLEELIAVQTAGEKDKKVKELEKSYSDMEGRLSRLEGRLEILIDGFTALAQEMNRIKRARLSSRSPQERRPLPPVTTVLPLPFSNTPRPPVTARTFTGMATVLKSIPTPALPTNRPSSAAKKTTQLQSISKSSRSRGPSRSVVPATSTPPDPATPPATTSRHGGRRATGTTKRVSQTSHRRATGTRKEQAITKFQLEPPIYKAESAKAERAGGNRRKKAFGSDAPLLKHTSEKASEGGFNKSAEQHNSSGRKVFPTTKPASVVPARTPPAGSRKSTPPKPKGTTAKRSTTAGKRRSTPSKTRKTTKISTTAKRSKTTPPKTRARTVTKKSLATARRKPPPAKSEAKRKAAQRLQAKRSSVLDLLQLLQGDPKSAQQKKSQDSSLHVVLGRLAIPIKIIPDY